MAIGDLLTVEEAMRWLGVDGAQAGDVATIVTMASAWLDTLCRRKLAARDYTDLRFTASGTKLYPDAWPISVSAPITITLDEIAQTVWRSEADGDLDRYDVVVASDDPWDEAQGVRNHFYRRYGWQSVLGMGWVRYRKPSDGPVGRYRVRISCRAGYEPVPEMLKTACKHLVTILWRDWRRRGAGAMQLSTPTRGSITVRDELPEIVRDTVALYRARPPIEAI